MPIMALASKQGYKGTKLESVNRCRIYTKSLFLSDVANAAGNRIDSTRSGSEEDYSYANSCSYPNTSPSELDWMVWEHFWKQYCMPDGTFPRTLGKWLQPSHKYWRWRYNPVTDTIIYTAASNEYWRYQPTGEHVGAVTRRSYQYGRVSISTSVSDETLQPITVTRDPASGIVTRLAGGPSLLKQTVEKQDFWTYISKLRGEWMWESIHNPTGLEPVQDAIRDGTAILVTDGSYNRKIRADLDSAGWILFCRKRKKILLKCSFYEVSPHAGSYRGELLGLASIHVFLAAIEQYYGYSASDQCTIACDNLGALNKARYRRKKIPSGAISSQMCAEYSALPITNFRVDVNTNTYTGIKTTASDGRI